MGISGSEVHVFNPHICPISSGDAAEGNWGCQVAVVASLISGLSGSQFAPGIVCLAGYEPKKASASAGEQYGLLTTPPTGKAASRPCARRRELLGLAMQDLGHPEIPLRSVVQRCQSRA